MIKASAGNQTLAWLQHEAARLGYRFERSADGLEERMVRPDGTVAVYARRTRKHGQA